MSFGGQRKVAENFADMKSENPVAYLKAVVQGVDIDRTLKFAEYAESIFGGMDLDESEFDCMLKTARRIAL